MIRITHKAIGIIGITVPPASDLTVSYEDAWELKEKLIDFLGDYKPGEPD